MNTRFHNPLFASMFQTALASALFLMPMMSEAQTFFGSGGTTNTATNTPNLAFGYEALFSNTTGTMNAAYGAYNLYYNTTGYCNTA